MLAQAIDLREQQAGLDRRVGPADVIEVSLERAHDRVAEFERRRVRGLFSTSCCMRRPYHTAQNWRWRGTIERGLQERRQAIQRIRLAIGGRERGLHVGQALLEDRLEHGRLAVKW